MTKLYHLDLDCPCKATRDEVKFSALKQKSDGAWPSACVLMNQILDPFSIYSHGHNSRVSITALCY